MNYLVVIPARYQSSRLPGKPLALIGGLPMIVRTYNQCLKAVAADRIIVATDDSRISSVCEAHGIKVVLTSSDCLTGTDRVAEVAGILPADTYINVQGDEPLFDPDDISLLLESVARHPDDVINGYCDVVSEELYRSPTIPKVIVGHDNRLLYMSRSPIPATKSNVFVKAWRQVCIYAFPKDSLREFALQASKTEIEEIEDIEILRFLEMGRTVRMVKMSDHSIAVDTPEDLEKVRRKISEASQ